MMLNVDAYGGDGSGKVFTIGDGKGRRLMAMTECDDDDC